MQKASCVCVQQEGCRVWGMKSCHCIRSGLGTVIVISEWSWHASRENNDALRICRENPCFFQARLNFVTKSLMPYQVSWDVIVSNQNSQKSEFAINWLNDTQKFFPNLQTSRDKFEPEHQGNHAPQEHKQTWHQLENYSWGITFDWSRWEVAKVGVATQRSADGREVMSPEMRVGADRLGNCWCRQMNAHIKGVPLEYPFPPLLLQKQ